MLDSGNAAEIDDGTETRPAPLRIELALDPDDVPRLARLAPLSRSRRRGTPVSIVWHDTPEGALAREGLALAQAGGTWRLERSRPGAAPWLPATPPPVLAEGPDPAAFDGLPDGPLVPLAAFRGETRGYLWHDGAAVADILLLDGALHGVTEERRASRLLLSGQAAVLARAAEHLAGALGVAPPSASLAALATALSRGEAPPARRTGAPHVSPGTSVAEAFAAVTGHLVDVVLHWGAEVPHAATPEPVHQMRVAVRRLRSALSVFRRAASGEALSAANADLKALAAVLGAARDWDVFLGGTGALLRDSAPADRRVAALLAAAARRREAAYDALRAHLAGAAHRRAALRLALLPLLRPWAEETDEAGAKALDADIAAYARKALTRRLRHVLAPGEDLLALPPPELHDVRKQAKRLRYASEFFRGLYAGKRVKRFLGRLEALQEVLGEVNDTHTTGHLLAQLGTAGRGYAAGLAQGYAFCAARHARGDVAEAWQRFRAEPAFWD